MAAVKEESLEACSGKFKKKINFSLYPPVLVNKINSRAY